MFMKIGNNLCKQPQLYYASLASNAEKRWELI